MQRLIGVKDASAIQFGKSCVTGASYKGRRLHRHTRIAIVNYRERVLRFASPSTELRFLLLRR